MSFILHWQESTSMAAWKAWKNHHKNHAVLQKWSAEMQDIQDCELKHTNLRVFLLLPQLECVFI